MRLRLSLLPLLVAALAFPPPAAATAQGTAADSVHWRATKIDLDSIARDKTAPLYSKRAQARLRLRDSLRAVAPPAPTPNPDPTPTPTPTPVPTPIQTARIEVKPSSGSFPVGSPVPFTAIPKSAAGVTLPAAVAWSASPASVATISGVGVLTPIAAGAVTVTARADTASRSVTITVLPDLPPQPPVVTPTDTTKPGPVPTPTPVPAPVPAPGPVQANLGLNIATVAELPRASVNTSYPKGLTQVRLAPGASLQAAVNSAAPGTEILLPRGATYLGGVLLPKHACTAPIVIRTDVPDAILGDSGTRMTPARAAAIGLAKVLSVDNQQAIGTVVGSGAGCWRLVGLEFAQAPGVAGAADANGLVRFGDNVTNSLAGVGANLILDRSYVHGETNVPVRRCIILNSASSAVVDSYLAECHSNNGDAQCLLGYNGPGPYLFLNSLCEGGAEVVMFGGVNPSIPNLVPSDITIRNSVIRRQPRDKKVWLAKNLIECKNCGRVLIEGNLIENNWADAQTGYALLLKSVNQSSGGCSWCTSQDITVKNNRIQNSGNGLNLAGIQEGPAVAAARYTITGNVVDSLNVGIFTADGIPLQVLGGTLSDVILAHNTIAVHAGALWGLLNMTGATTRLVLQDNLMYCGGYGIKGQGLGVGLPSWTAGAPGGGWQSNAGFGCSSGLPATTQYLSSASAPVGLGSDGRPIGANTAALALQLARIGVPISRARSSVRIPTAAQTGWKPTSAAQREYNTTH
jgi:hypothetical protein